jgi:hypothetical protein
MSGQQTSPEYAAIHIPNVLETFATIVAKRPAASSLVPFVQDPSQFTALHKYEWLEHKRTPVSWTVNGVSAIASPALILDATLGVKKDDVLGFKAPTGASVSVRAKVTTVTDGTNLVIERITSTSFPDEEIPDNATVYLISRAKGESSTADAADNEKPARKFNYTQILRRDIQLSRTLLQSKVYGLKSLSPADKREAIQNMLDFQVEAQLQQLAYELNQSLIDGHREERVDGGDNGMMGGMREYLKENASSVYDAGGADISPTILNNAVDQVSENGGDTTSLTVLLCHPRQARKVSAFNVSGNNPVIVRGDVTAGSYVAQYQSDLGGSNGGALVTIVVDRNWPEDEVAIINPNNLRFVPMETMSVVETTRLDGGRIADDLDGRKWKLLGELTLEYKNAADEAVIIEDLGL